MIGGNSLLNVEKNLFNESLFNELEALKPLYFDETDSSKKEGMRKRIESLINKITEGKKQFDFSVYFSEIFHRNSGFDIVIGNPPYGIVFEEKFKSVLLRLYPSFKLNSDVYTAFIERGMKLLRSGGDFAFITPNTYLNGDYFKSLRLFLSGETVVEEITDYKQVSVFDDQTVFTSVLLCSFSRPVFPHTVRLRVAQTSITEFADEQFVLVSASDAPFKPADPIFDRLKVDHRWATVDELFFVKDVGFNYWTTGRGKKRGNNSIGDRVFYSGTQKNRNDIPFLKGRDIVPWGFTKPDNFLKHDYEKSLDPKKDTFRFSLEFLSFRPKVIYRQTSNTIIAAIDPSGHYVDKTVHIIIPRSGWRPEFPEKLLLGLLNSRLLRYLYRNISQETEGRAFAQVKTTYIKKLPVPRNCSDETEKIATVVEQISGDCSQARLLKLEAELNETVYKLYGLSKSEIASVEDAQSN